MTTPGLEVTQYALLHVTAKRRWLSTCPLPFTGTSNRPFASLREIQLWPRNMVGWPISCPIDVIWQQLSLQKCFYCKGCRWLYKGKWSPAGKGMLPIMAKDIQCTSFAAKELENIGHILMNTMHLMYSCHKPIAIPLINLQCEAVSKTYVCNTTGPFLR